VLVLVKIYNQPFRFVAFEWRGQISIRRGPLVMLRSVRQADFYLLGSLQNDLGHCQAAQETDQCQTPAIHKDFATWARTAEATLDP